MKQIFSILINPTNHSYLDWLGQGVRHKNAKYQLLWFFGNSFQIQSIKEKCTAKYNETREVSQIASTDLCRTFKLSLISRYFIFCIMAWNKEHPISNYFNRTDIIKILRQKGWGKNRFNVHIPLYICNIIGWNIILIRILVFYCCEKVTVYAENRVVREPCKRRTAVLLQFL